ncbi:MAG: hypothetical protein ACHQRK_11795, partial [Gemmatimonadales bacterium]
MTSLTFRGALSSRRVVIPVTALLMVAAIAARYEHVREAMDRRAYPAPVRLVDVGGRGMYLSCTGSGAPTVVMLPGAGEISAAWGWIAPRVAR